MDASKSHPLLEMLNREASKRNSNTQSAYQKLKQELKLTKQVAIHLEQQLLAAQREISRLWQLIQNIDA